MSELSVRELDREILDLQRERTRVDENLRRLETSARRFRSAEERWALPTPVKIEPAPDASSRKRVRSRSARKSDDGEKRKGDEDREQRRKLLNEGRAKPDERSRNMFGKLVGHLHAAKQRLETEKDWKSTELNNQAHQRIEQKLSQTKMTGLEMRRQQFELQKREEESRAAAIDKKIEEKELLLLQKQLEAHYSRMMNFIRTKAEPTIFFLPAKHTSETERMLEETREAIRHKVASLRVELKPLNPDPPSEEGPADALTKAEQAEQNESEKPPKRARHEESDSSSVEDEKNEEEKEERDENGVNEVDVVVQPAEPAPLEVASKEPEPVKERVAAEDVAQGESSNCGLVSEETRRGASPVADGGSPRDTVAKAVPGGSWS